MRSIWLGVALVGCDGGTGGLAVHAPGATLVVVQDGDGPWQQLALDADDTGRFDTTAGFYGVAHFCPPLDFGGGTSILLGARVILETELRAIELSCSPQPQPNVHLTGTTSPDAELWIDQNQAFADPSGAYDVEVPPGTYDVVALSPGTPRKLLVERDVDVAADRVLDLPVATAGVELLAMTPTVTGGNATDSALWSDLNTRGNTYVLFDSNATTVAVPPVGALVDGDRPTIGAGSAGCAVQQPLTLATPSFQIPTELNARVDRATTEWSADPAVAWESARLSLRGAVGSSMTVFVQTSWLEARGDTAAFPTVDPAEFPGWLPELGSFFPDGASVSANFGLSRGRFDGDFTSCETSTTFAW